MIGDEHIAYSSGYRENIDHYRRLLRTNLTALERNFIERRIAEEQKALDRLASETLLIVTKEQAKPGFDAIEARDVS